eukprot:6000165-Pleurochrysis_carterae.AAC.1
MGRPRACIPCGSHGRSHRRVWAGALAQERHARARGVREFGHMSDSNCARPRARVRTAPHSHAHERTCSSCACPKAQGTAARTGAKA